MSERLFRIVARWAEGLGIDPSACPSAGVLGRLLEGVDEKAAIRPGATRGALDSWERRHGFALPESLRAWLLESDGLSSRGGPLVHPLMAIGPMIPFARVPGLVVQPESWYELGNPGAETVCIDLAYTWPGGSFPIFSSGDDENGTSPRLIAVSFEAWLLRVLGEGGRAYWLDAGFEGLGDPWVEHRRRAPAPELPDRLHGLLDRARRLMRPGVDERRVAHQLGVTADDVESLFRHIQHRVGGRVRRGGV